MKNLIILFVMFFTLYSCAADNKSIPSQGETSLIKQVVEIEQSSNEVAYFASGCFWCVEAIFESVRGVMEVESGYSGGEIKNPTYEQICTGKLKHAESVKVIYNPEIVSYSTLLEVFFNSHDPSTLNRQGPDAGPQYRSIAFFQNSDQKVAIEKKINMLLEAKVFSKVTTEVKEFEVFYKAE